MSHTKNFSLLVLGQIISLFGNAILRFALPLCLFTRNKTPQLFYSSIIVFCHAPITDRLSYRRFLLLTDIPKAKL